MQLQRCDNRSVDSCLQFLCGTLRRPGVYVAARFQLSVIQDEIPAKIVARLLKESSPSLHTQCPEI